MIKAALVLHHGRIPASLYFTKPNPALQLDESPFTVAATARDLAVDAEHVYLAAGGLVVLDKSTGGRATLYEGDVRAIAVDAAGVYWGEADQTSPTYGSVFMQKKP